MCLNDWVLILKKLVDIPILFSMDIFIGLIGLVVGTVVTSILMRQAQKPSELRLADALERERLADEEKRMMMAKIEEKEESLRSSLSTNESLRATLAERDAAHERQIESYRQAEVQMKDAFKALSGDALENSTKQLIAQAEEVLKRYTEKVEGDDQARRKEIEGLLKPVKENLDRLDNQNQQMERHRQGAYKELSEQLRALNDQQSTLKTETGRLVKALQDPGSGGSWGEMVLERVVEMAGLQEYSSYETQLTLDSDESRQRLDMIIRLPGERTLIIDSKAPMRSYVTALETDDESTKEALLIDHAHKLLGHCKELKKRDYSKTLQTTPDFVVLFVPSESAYRVAVERRPALFEEAHENNVVIATPTTLLALLKAVAYGWKQETLATSARELQRDAALLYDRVCKMTEHYVNLGKALSAAGRKYNEMGGALESRVLPAARRFKEHGVPTNNLLAVVEPVEFDPRPLQSAEFVNGPAVVLPGLEP